MTIKNNDGRRIKSCDICLYCSCDSMGQPYCKLIDCELYLSFKIPIECSLPNWRRTTENKMKGGLL